MPITECKGGQIEPDRADKPEWKKYSLTIDDNSLGIFDLLIRSVQKISRGAIRVGNGHPIAARYRFKPRVSSDDDIDLNFGNLYFCGDMGIDRTECLTVVIFNNRVSDPSKVDNVAGITMTRRLGTQIKSMDIFFRAGGGFDFTLQFYREYLEIGEKEAITTISHLIVGEIAHLAKIETSEWPSVSESMESWELNPLTLKQLESRLALVPESN